MHGTDRVGMQNVTVTCPETGICDSHNGRTRRTAPIQALARTTELVGICLEPMHASRGIFGAGDRRDTFTAEFPQVPTLGPGTPGAIVRRGNS